MTPRELAAEVVLIFYLSVLPRQSDITVHRRQRGRARYEKACGSGELAQREADKASRRA